MGHKRSTDANNRSVLAANSLVYVQPLPFIELLEHNTLVKYNTALKIRYLPKDITCAQNNSGH